MKVLKKKKGTLIETIAVSGVCLIIFTIIMLTDIYSTSSVSNKNKVDNIARNYLLKMETEGFLSDSNKNDLIKALTDIGVKNISVAESCSTKVKYGNYVTLKFTADIPYKELSSDNLDLKVKDSYITKDYTLTSTAKY